MSAILKRCFCLLLCVLTAACEQPEHKEQPVDILTQTIIPDDKIPVTVLVKHAFSIHAFEKAVEELFPQIDIIQVGNHTRDRGIVEYERRLRHDDLPDIVMTWPLDVGEKYWEDRLIDMSSMPFSGKYSTSMLNSLSRDGKLYYLPGPAQIRGIAYNKTLFEEKGWSVPHDFDSFVELCRKIEASGMRSIQLGFGNPEVLDAAFVGYSYGKCFSSPADAQWLTDYNNGKGRFGDQFAPALNIFQKLIDMGVWKKNDLNLTYADREAMLFTRQCAMVEDSVLVTRLGGDRTGTTDKFALMPFFTPGTSNDWARLYMVCYIGLNKHLAEPVNKKKYELVLQLMEYISTPEGQTMLAADTEAMYSSLNNVPPPDIPEIAPLIPTLSHRRYAIFPELKNAQGALRQGLAGMLAGTLTPDAVSTLVDQQNQAPSSPLPRKPVGTASEDFSLLETGNFITDAMRARSGAHVALFLDNGKDGRYNSKGVSARLYKGEQYEDDVDSVLPDLSDSERGVLQVVKMKGDDLIRTLEHAIPVRNNRVGWFYYFSGLRMEYAPAGAPGTRISKLSDTDGNPIIPQRIYTVAAMDKTLPANAILSVTDTDITIKDLLIEAIRLQGTISPRKDGRFVIRQP